MPWSLLTATVAEAAVSYTTYHAPLAEIDMSQSPSNGWSGCGSTRRNEAPASVDTHSGEGWVKPPWEHVRIVWPSGLTVIPFSASAPGPSNPGAPRKPATPGQ